MKSYALRKVTTAKARTERFAEGKGVGYSITIPAEIGEKVPDGVTFAAEWHKDGILLRKVTPGTPPEWAK